MKPVSGLKYPEPSITALPAAAELTTIEARLSASLISWLRLASSATYSGLSLSEPWGLIMLLFFLSLQLCALRS